MECWEDVEIEAESKKEAIDKLHEQIGKGCLFFDNYESSTFKIFSDDGVCGLQLEFDF